MEQDNPKLKALHESLLKDNYELPSYDIFAEDLRSPEKSKAFYDGLAKDNYELPDYEVFVNDLGLKKKDASDYGLPTKEVMSSMFSNISKEDLEAQGYYTDPAKEFKTPDLTLKSTEFKGYEEPSITQIIGQTLSKDRIALHKEEYKKKAEERIIEIDKEIAALPESKTDFMVTTVNIPFAGPSIAEVPVSDEKAKLLKEKDDLRLATTDPTKLDYILGKAYNQSIIGLSDAIINGQKRAPEEWLAKYDAGTLTDVTATTLGFLLDMPFFGGMGKVGLKAGTAAAKPFVDRAMTRTAEKLIIAGFPEVAAKELALKAATKTSQIIAGMSSSGVALGSYGAVTSALSDWSLPDADFDDIKWGNAFKRGAKDLVLGTGVGGLGVASAAIASKASAIPGTAARIGTKAGVAAGGLTAESGLFAYGGALLDGRAPKDVTGKEFLETLAMLSMLKLSKVPKETLDIALEPKKAAVRLYESLRFKKPGEGPFEVDIEPWEIDAIGGKDYKTVMDILSKDDAVLGNILKSDQVPAILKHKLLWGSRGVALKDVNVYSDKVEAVGEYINVYNKEGVLVDKRKAPTKEDASQAALEIGLQLEDNKMQMKAAAPETDKVKIISELKSKGTDIPTVLSALDKPVSERTPEENKIVGDYSKLVPKGDLKPQEESKLSIGEIQFASKEELNAYLENVAIDKKTGEVDERWFDREVNAWPTPETVKAINEWTENKKVEIEAKKPKKKEEPVETGVVKPEQKELTKNELIDEVRRYSILSASQKKKNALRANTIRVNAQRLGYELKEGDEWKVGVMKDGKFFAVRKDPIKVDKAKIESQKLLAEKDQDFQDYVNDVMETNPDLYGVLIGGLTNEQRAQAFRDIKEGKKTTASSTALNELERMYKEHGGIDIWNAEGKIRVSLSRDDIRAEREDLIKRNRAELDKYSYQDADILLEKGLITKTEYDEITEGIRKAEQESRNAEEDYYANISGDVEGGKEKGTEGELKAIKFYDALKKNNAPRIQVRDEWGNERLVFDPASRNDFMDKSDETGRKIRWGAELSDGRMVSLDGLIRITQPDVWAKWESRIKGMKLENKNEFIIKQTLDKNDFNQLLESTIDFLETENVYSETYRGRDDQGNRKTTTDINDSKINKILREEGHPLAGIFNRELTLKDGSKVNPYQTWLFDLDQGKRITGGKETNKIVNEQPVKQPDITTGKAEGDIVSGGAETGKKPVAPKGKAEPRTTDTVKQKQIDAIDKEYDAKIVDKQKELDAIPDQIERAVKKANERVGLFGDLKPVEKDEIIKREEQGFEVTSETVKNIRKPFEERAAELTKEIDALNKERESKIGEILKQQTLGFKEKPDIQKIATSLQNDERVSAKKNKVVTLDMKLADEAFQRDEGYYIGKGDQGMGNRRKQIEQRIADGELNIAPLASIILNKKGEPILSFTDGRHRFAVLRDMGATKINISLSPSSMKYIDQLRTEKTPTRELPTTKDQIRFTRGGREWTADVLHVYPDGRVDVDVFGRKTINPEEYEIVGKEKPIAEKEITVTKEGIQYGDKTYTDIEQVQDDYVDNKLTLKEQNEILEEVRKFEDGLRDEARKISDEIGSKIDEGASDIEKKFQDEINDEKSKLSIKFFPDIVSRANTALYTQLVKVRDALANNIANQLKKGVISQTAGIRWSAKTLTNLYNGLLRTQTDIHGKSGSTGKLEMMGTVKAYAPHKAFDLLNTWRNVVNSDTEALSRVWAVLDPELATKAGERPLVYGDLSLAEKNLYFILKEWNTWVWSTNYANGLIPTESHLKFKGDFEATGYSDYIARMYDAFEEGTIMSPEIQEFINRGNSSVTSRLNTDYMRLREETNEWKQEHAIKDPAYLTAKRVMQTIQNVAVKQYMDLVIAEHPEYVKKLKRGEEVPKGFTKLGSSYSWGPLRNKAVANHIVEDFTGFFYQNALANSAYDVIKMFDRNKINQFYKKFRTVYNPFVQVGNNTGNVFFASINGINPFSFVKRMVENRNLHEKNPELYDRLLKSGLIGDVAITGEMKPIDPLNPKESLLGKADVLATKAYTGADNLAKISAYQIFRRQGMSHEKAIRRAYDAFQNYSTVGKTWDVASKIPLIGPTFVKFQADLQRILVNSMLTTPLTTIGTFIMIKMLGNLASALSGETEEEQEIRESRKGVARIPFVNISLSFKIGKSEVNVARYITPLFIFPQGDNDMDISELSKFMPLQFQKKDEDSLFPLPAFADASWGWVGSVLADRDFRMMSVQDPRSTKYTDPNITTEERILNVLNFAARSQIPFYKGAQDIYKGATGQLDYYGRKRNWYQAIINNIIKIQEFDKPELKSYIERNLDYLTSRYASLATRMGDANSDLFKSIKYAQDKGASEEVLAKLYKSESKIRDKRLQKSLDEQIPIMEEIERLTTVYKKWYPQDPFIQENYQNIEAGKNRRFNILNDVDMQKKYKDEYMLLKSNNLLKGPQVPSYIDGKELSETQRKDYLNTYWSEYVRQLDYMIGLTQEEFDEEKKYIIGREPSTTSPLPKETSLLEAKASEAASVAKSIADMNLRNNLNK